MSSAQDSWKNTDAGRIYREWRQAMEADDRDYADLWEARYDDALVCGADLVTDENGHKVRALDSERSRVYVYGPGCIAGWRRLKG